MTATDMQLHAFDGKNTVATPHIKKHQMALREATKIERQMFTDAIKAFCEYVDSGGKYATAPERAYSNFTRQVYAEFGLNKKQIEAWMNDEEYGRDYFSAMELTFVRLAELAATQALLIGMERGMLRSDIKKAAKNAIASAKAGLDSVDIDKIFGGKSQ